MEVTMGSIIIILLLTYFLIGGIMFGLQTTKIVDDDPEFCRNCT
jgi:glycerol-3-phosphate acyltransferase PlsY